MSSLNYNKIKGLIYTEKSNQLPAGKYCFRVESSCDKSEIASLIRHSFGVTVKKMNTINTKPKTKRFKGVVGERKSYKKVIVTLENGQSINFA